MNGFGSMLKDYLDYNRISQTDFADRLGISQKHMNEIINGKTNMSTELILLISLLTNIDANLIYYAENKKRIYNELINKYKNEKNINKMLEEYHLNEMCKRNWINLKDKSSFVQNYIDLLDYLNVKDLDTLDDYISKRYNFKKKENADNKKIYLWIRNCDRKTKDIRVEKYDSSKYSLLLDELKKESNKEFNKDSIIKILNKYGIILYIEDALKGTKVRGCIKVSVNTPIIYMTTLYKEKSSFYYTLYHELIHLKKDYNTLKNKVVIEDNEKETEIDRIALNLMIDETTYKKILTNFEERDKIAKENNIPLCFLYTRLARDKIIEYNSKDYLKHIERL